MIPFFIPDLAEETKLGHGLSDNNACSNVEIAHNVTLKGGTRAGIFKEVGRMVDMKKCVSSCCDKPECDIAYLLNGHCFSVQCLDGNLCQTTAEPVKAGDTVALAYMNKAGLGEYKRGKNTILNNMKPVLFIRLFLRSFFSTRWVRHVR